MKTSIIFNVTNMFSLFVVLLFLGFTQTAVAATHLVSPLAIDLNLERRDITTQYITVTNTTDRLLRLYASVNTVATDGNGIVEGFVQPVEADRTNTPTSWIEISRKRMELKPKEVREIPFKVQMNPNTKPGEYNVLISFADASNRAKAEKKVREGDAPGTIVHIAVDQEQNQFLRLEHFSVNKFISASDGDTLTFTLSNPSRVDIVPSGEIIFYDNNGVEVDAMSINTTKLSVPASGETQFSMEVPEALSLGKYKAFLSVEYGEFLTASVHDTAFFYVLPWKLILLMFVIALIVAVLIALYVHRRYDIVEENDGAGSVAMYVKEGTSEALDHDIDLSKNNK
jgi:hypothetical protein